MFEGTPGAPKGVFDRACESSGGNNNGQTRPDVTIYVETAPAAALPRFLWLEADRMAALDFSQETLDNQRDVVKEEIRLNIQNDPYGLFEHSELPKATFDKWENAHDGYGDFHDLDAATLDDVRSFFASFYRPNNAILAVAGDVRAGEVFASCERLFRRDPRGAPCPPGPDLAEPPRAGAGSRRLEGAAREDAGARRGLADATAGSSGRLPAPRPRRAAPRGALEPARPRPRRPRRARDRGLGAGSTPSRGTAGTTAPRSSSRRSPSAATFRPRASSNASTERSRRSPGTACRTKSSSA